MNFNGVKRGFTLIELIVVIILISSTYFLVFSNNSFGVKKEEKKLGLYNLKEYLLDNFKFTDELIFSCIEENFSCYVTIDGQLNAKFKVKNFFKQIPEVYEYNKEEKRVEFDEIRIDNSNHNIIFELKINDDYKTNEFIVNTLDKEVFVFNSIFTKPKIYNSLNESFEAFNINKSKVRDAF